jgi:LemA protein
MKKAMEKKHRWGLWIPLSILALLILWFVGTYNSLIRLDNGVEEKWAQVENQYQRRFDLIPNLIETVKGFAAQEKDIFTEVTRLRTQWSNAQTRPEQLQAAQGLDSAVSRLLLVAENYPQLKSNENFLALQSQLEGTENRVATERKRYNEDVLLFNTKIRTFPSSLIAGMFGYQKKDYFQIDAGTDQVPQVQFT